MSGRVRERLGHRGTIVLLTLLLSLFATVGAYAASGHGHSGDKKKPGTNQAKPQDEGTQGGTIARFHGDGQTSCDIPAGADALGGNWSHGDFVSDWAKAFAAGEGVATAAIGSVPDAARSACGKPAHSLGHGNSAGHRP